MTAPTPITLDHCLALDADDPLAGFRDRFHLPDGVIYLDGNSLGPLPAAVRTRLERVVEAEWGRDLITSWNVHDWIGLPARVGDKIARLVGAAPGSVVCADSTSVNLFKALAAALDLRPDRRVILSDSGNFPTDLYVAQGLVRLLDRGHELRLVEPEGVADALTDDVAVLMLTQVDYRTGRLHHMADLTRRAHGAGAVTLWDLSHSAGALPVDLAGAGADLAVGCGYKYLNGGPGAPAFLYVAPRLQDAVRPPLSGWMGHEAPFAFDLDYRPAGGIGRNLCGTPPVLGMTALDAALDVILDADMAQIRAKSQALCALFIDLVEQECRGHGFTLASPADPDARGSQVSFRHAQGYPVMAALIASGVIGDFRAPDLVRFGFTPLYLTFSDVWDAVAVLRGIMETRAWDAPEYHRRAAVT
ncbi:MAG: kynureninase [Hyphomicrobiales bacterium]|nr:kynureninase [Hyphomicrobiales bacterium]MCP5371002.1 kynureninase [Hyphomicrobiales bacterium]